MSTYMTAGDAAHLLTAYDQQLRRDAELAGATETIELGPLMLAIYPRGRAFVTYRNLAASGTSATPDSIRELVQEASRRLSDGGVVTKIEWKTRGHDDAPGLHDALIAAGFTPGERESVMIGAAEALTQGPELPPGITVHQASTESEVIDAERVAGEIFGDSAADIAASTEEIVARFRQGTLEMWFAQAGGRIVTSGRLEPVAGTEFAGIWGGSTAPKHRGQGIYRALTAARARSAIGHGKKWIHCDSTEFSRPILERAGLVKVATTTPYEWRR